MPTPPSSELILKFVNEETSLVNAHILKPLKVFALKRGKSCQIVSSNYGGGFVEGDEIHMKVLCESFTRTAFTSQANTRVYKSIQGKACVQNIEGTLKEGALATFLCDPVVLHKHGVFSQRQYWQLDPSAVLLATDWFEAGRVLNGERFEFESFRSEFKVDQNGLPLVWDQFRLEPKVHNANAAGSFLHHSSYLNVFLVGDKDQARVQLIDQLLKAMFDKHFKTEKTLIANEAPLIGTYARINDRVALVRCSALNSDKIRPLMVELCEGLKTTDLLGFNPWHTV